jgi:MFS family permease
MEGSAALPPRVATRAMALLVAMRVVYAYNWFDAGSILPQIGPALQMPSSLWGASIGAFLAGAAAFQVPAGLLSLRRGARSIALLGGLVLGASAFASGLSQNMWEFLFLRFAAGAGAGLFFSPAISLVHKLRPEGQRGIFVGLFSSAFAAGAGLGTFLPPVIEPAVGWPVSLALGGGLMLVLTGMAWLWVPEGTSGRSDARPSRPPSGIPRPLTSMAVWAIGFAFVGLEGASISSGQFFASYAQLRGWTPALAGTLGALFVFPSLFGGPVGGRLNERFTNRRTQFFVFTAFPGLLLALVPFVSVLGVAAIAITFAFTFGMVYAMMYVIPPYLPGLTQEDVPLAIGLLNAVQLAGGAALAAVTGWVLATRGYAAGWEFLAAAIIVPLVLLLAVPTTGKDLAARPGASSSGTSRGDPS